MIPVIVIRPQPGCDTSVDAARSMDLDARGFPLFEVNPVAWDPPDPGEVDALLIGSANALRHAGASLSRFRGKPAYAVGDATAQAARAAELDVVATGGDGMQATLELVQARHRKLLRLTGQTRVALSASDLVTIAERVVYRSEPLPMPTELAEMLREPALVLLHSAEAARHFAAQCASRKIDRSAIHLAAMAPRIAEAAGSGWAKLATAERPDDAALLALARQMCQELAGSSQMEDKGSEQTPMQDELSSQRLPAASSPRTGRTILIVAILAFILGAGVAGWLDWRGDIDFAQAGLGETAPASGILGTNGDAASSEEAASNGNKPPTLDALGSVETRLALLEDRLSRLNLEANAASGNAARAEGLLIAFAARRVTDKGGSLGYLEDQLKLRFADAQPLAVGAIIDFAKEPVTLDELGGRLDALAPELTGSTSSQSTWSWIAQEFTSLFEIRRSSSPVMTPEDRIERAKLMLSAGKIDKAIEQVERLPGADAAEKWLADARRYAAVQGALDLIETTAMLEPRRLQDAEGKKVDQPSPLAQPADAVKPKT